VPGKKRCRWHGGLSTGPKTPEGRARSFAARDAGRARYFAGVKALGIKRTSGRGGRITENMARKHFVKTLLHGTKEEVIAEVSKRVAAYKREHNEK